MIFAAAAVARLRLRWFWDDDGSTAEVRAFLDKRARVAIVDALGEFFELKVTVEMVDDSEERGEKMLG